MLQPKRTKYRRPQKGRCKGNAQRGNQLAFGSFGIKSLDTHWLTGRQIEAARVAMTRRLNMRIGLWFNPSIQNEFADWQKDAEAVLSLWRRYGITIFKIDGLQIPTKLAEQRLRNFFDEVTRQSGGNVIFNLDATAGRRGGYNMFNEYGNIFLENRYTDWGNNSTSLPKARNAGSKSTIRCSAPPVRNEVITCKIFILQ